MGEETEYAIIPLASNCWAVVYLPETKSERHEFRTFEAMLSWIKAKEGMLEKS